ncbi:kelch-like protein 40b [Dendronephthya gigantea]|uniref:kelch-like protein 40b n=1 Tax=Dendronephthya gigantea TaxID=151771 RepID=UPI00106D83DF|nr:kelch-like protein 40b [Dendronephthya gigantea]
MPEKREGATSFVYNNHMTIAGGYRGGSGIVDDMIRMNIDPNSDLSTHWSGCPVELPDKLQYHSSVLYNDQLIVSGGQTDGKMACDQIRAVQLVPPYTVTPLPRMPEQRKHHSMEIFDDNLLIVGGSTTGNYKDNLSSVVLYDIKKNELKQNELKPLPYEVSRMATVRWGAENIVVIGGEDKQHQPLDAVIIYNVKTEQSHMLPSMKYKRYGCTAVVIKHNIVVLGGFGEQHQIVKSVEGFNFESYSWEDLPEMSVARGNHTAVVV